MKKVQVQVNPLITGKTKEENKKSLPLNNKIDKWKTADAKLKHLCIFINHPMMYRFGIKSNGNNKGDVDYVTGLGFDFDNETEETQITLSDIDKMTDEYVVDGCSWKYGDYAISHNTLSSTISNPKFRLLYVYDEKINVEEHEKIYRFVLENSPIFMRCDRGCQDAGRGFFGGTNAEIGFAPKPIEVRKLLEAIDKQTSAIATPKSIKTANGSKKQSTKRTKTESDKPGAGDKEQYLIKELKREHNVEFIHEIPPEELFFEYDHKFMKCAEDDKNIIAKYHGSNPFSDSNKSGQSFVVSYIHDEDGYEKLPVWYDRSNNESSETQNKNGSNYFEYIKKLNDFKNFNSTWTYICEKFEVNPRTYKQRTTIPNDYHDLIETEFNKFDIMELKIKLDVYIRKYITKLDTNDKDTLFIFKVGNINQWKIHQDYDTMWCDSIVPGLIRPYMKSCYNPRSDRRTEAELNIIIEQWVVEYHFKKPIYKMYTEMLDKTVKINLSALEPYHDRFVPFINGFYDVCNREFIGELPDGMQALNTNLYRLVYNHNVEECKKDFEEFQEVLAASYNTPESACDLKTYFLWVILNVLRIGYKTKNIVGLIGTAGTGKTSNGEILMKLCESFAGFAQEAHFSAGDKFGSSHYVEKEVLVINEFKGSADSSQIKAISGTGEAQSVNIEKKGLQAVTYMVRWAFTLISEGIPYQRVDDGGMGRRMIYIDHNDVEKFPRTDPRNELRLNFMMALKMLDGYYGGNFDTNHEFRYSTKVANIVSHIMRNFDPKEVLNEWSEHVSSESYTQRTRDVVNENNPINDFVETHLTITNEETDYITKNELAVVVEAYHKNYPGGKKPFPYTSIKHVKSFLDKLESFNWKLRSKDLKNGDRKTVNGKSFVILKGLKIRKDSDEMTVDASDIINNVAKANDN